MTVTTMMLPSRSVRKRRAMSRAPGRGAREDGSGCDGAPGAGVGAPPSVRTSLMRPVFPRLRGGHARRRRGALVAALRVVVRGDRRLVEELQARVHVGDARQGARDLVHVEL